MKRLAWYAALILLTLTALILVWQFRTALLLFALSLATAAAFHPFIDKIQERGLARSWAVALAYLAFVLLVVILLFFLGRPLLNDIRQATDDLTAFYEQIKMEWPVSGSLFQKTLAEQLPESQNLYDSLTGQQGTEVLQAVFGVASNAAQLIGELVVILILSLYWSADSVRFERQWLSLLPVSQRTHVTEIWRDIEAGVGHYVESEAIQSLLAVVVLWLGYQAMGLKYPALLSLIGALSWLIPWLGAVLAITIPLLVGMGSSLSLGILAALFTLSILIVLEFFVQPRFFPHERYSSLLLVLVVTAFALTFGLVGVFLAPPVAVAIQILINYFFQPQAAEPKLQPVEVTAFNEVEMREIAELRTRLLSIHELVAQRPPTPETTSLLDRLDRLFEKTNDYLQMRGISNS
jgi:predicted PurR-regulated permease PerM